MRAVDPSSQAGDTYARSTIDAMAAPANGDDTAPAAEAAPAPRKLTRIRRDAPAAAAAAEAPTPLATPAEGDSAAK